MQDFRIRVRVSEDSGEGWFLVAFWGVVTITAAEMQRDLARVNWMSPASRVRVRVRVRIRVRGVGLDVSCPRGHVDD